MRIFYIPQKFPSLNDWTGRSKWVYVRIKKVWLREFPPASIHRAYCTCRERPAPCMGFRSVMLVRIYPKARGQRRLDDDNLRGGAKPILDALRAHGWLCQDSPLHVVTRVEQRHPVGDERPHTTSVSIYRIR